MAESARMAQTAPTPSAGRDNPNALGLAPRPARDWRRAFASAAPVVTLATVAVVLLGAIVRITGSGAGCGQHWPTCNGEIVHLPQRLETWIELSHRTTSGLDFLGVLGLAALGLALPPRHPARLAAFGALGLMIVEILVGARLVLLNLVGSNMSIDRVVVMPIHLVTTSLLIGSLAAASYFSSERRLVREATLSAADQRMRRTALAVTLAAGAVLLVVSMSGAVTALGDTVYPVQGQGTLEHLHNDQAAGSHLLGKLRVVHPLLALLGVAGLWAAAGQAREACKAKAVQRLGASLYAGGGLALGVGLLNIWLAAPGYLQVAHLLVACSLWLIVVVLAAMLWDATNNQKPAHADQKPRQR